MTMNQLIVYGVVLGLLLYTSPAASLECYSCYNCKQFEAAIQTKTCEPEQDRCIKKDLVTGDVNRSCTTKEKCNSGKDSNAKSFTCCSEDRCNSANQVGWQSSMMLACLVAYVTTNLTWD